MNKKLNSPVVRIPPSPTGNLHLGTARTALFNYLFAKKHGGQIFFRSEDTDRARSTLAFEENILNGLKWLGLTYDFFSRQSEHGERYQKVLLELLNSGVAYVSKEENKVDGGGEERRSEVIRFKNPNRAVSFRDILRGEISFDTKELGDFVIAKSLTEPLYHLAVVADDVLDGITHVIRGEDHISNTPRQILLIEALGATRPEYVHLPLILAPDRSKLSKRHGAVAVSAYEEMGFLPEAIVNYLALLGFRPDPVLEFFDLKELIERFDFERLQKSGAIFSLDKLRSINRYYLDRLSLSDFWLEFSRRFPNLAEQASWQRAMGVIKDRAATWGEVEKMISGEEFSFLNHEEILYEPELLLPKEARGEKIKELLAETTRVLENLPEDNWQTDLLKDSLAELAENHGRAVILHPMRVSLSGQKNSPDPFTLAFILGKERTLERLRKSADLL